MPTNANNFAVTVGTGFNPNPDDNVFNSMYKQYERVIFQSLITSFGLDLFIKDRLGGDVDTINNVRKGEEGGGYKSAANAAAYENRGGYEYDAYHDRNNTFQKTKHDARYAYNETKNP